jgi:hypothetical protein
MLRLISAINITTYPAARLSRTIHIGKKYQRLPNQILAICICRAPETCTRVTNKITNKKGRIRTYRSSPANRAAHPRAQLPGLGRALDLHTFDIEFSLSGNLISYTSYLNSGSTRAQTIYFYDETDKPLLAVNCDATGRYLSISSVRRVRDAPWEYWTNPTSAGIVTGTTAYQYNAGLLISLWNYDEQDRTKNEKNFQYAGPKLFKSVSPYYDFPDGIVERCITTYDAHGRVSQT